MVKKLLSSIIIAFLFLFSVSYSEDIDRVLQDFINTEKENYYSKSKIYVLSKSYGEFNFIGGYADGKYSLYDYIIDEIKPKIYILKLIFRKKKGSFSFTKKVSYYFYYDGEVIIFETYKGKVRYFIPDTKIKLIKTKDGYIVKKENPILRIVLPAKGGKVYLYLMFR